jgi:hypothetical protein
VERTVRSTYRHPDAGDEPRPDPYAAADTRLSLRVFAILKKHFPNHPWKAEAEHAQGIIQISIPPLMGPITSIINMDDVRNHYELEKLVRDAAGEIIERYRIPPGLEGFLEAAAARPLGATRNGVIPG